MPKVITAWEERTAKTADAAKERDGELNASGEEYARTVNDAKARHLQRTNDAWRNYNLAADLAQSEYLALLDGE